MRNALYLEAPTLFLIQKCNDYIVLINGLYT
jgi:hypothetical protein